MTSDSVQLGVRSRAAGWLPGGDSLHEADARPEEGTSVTKPRRRASEPFTAKGAWWDPRTPDDRVAGLFTWDPNDGGEVDLLGCLTRGDGAPDDEWRGDCLYGVAEGDGPSPTRSTS